MTLTNDQQKQFAVLLNDDLRTTLADLDRSNSDMSAIVEDKSNESGGGVPTNHMADHGSEDYERERLMTMRIEMETRAQMIRDAQGRMADGTYGTCQRCGKPIPVERLEALPFAAYDIECQEIVDAEQNVAGLKNDQPLEPFDADEATRAEH